MTDSDRYMNSVAVTPASSMFSQLSRKIQASTSEGSSPTGKLSHVLSDREPSSSRIEILRKRQAAAGKAIAKSTLIYTSSQQRRVPGVHDHEPEWLSDDSAEDYDELTSDLSTETTKVDSPAFLRHPYPRALENSMSSPMRSSPRRSVNHSAKRSATRSDQRWINLLERNNEELMTQISTLASDLSETEQHLKLRLNSAEEEVRLLSEQLSERDRAQKRCNDQYRKEMSSLRSRILDDNNRLSDAAALVTRLEAQCRTLTMERDASNVRLAKRDEEILRTKRRNAALAEQILHQRSLELTVEGQKRRLCELSTALEETRRMSCSESSLSPTFATPPQGQADFRSGAFFPANTTQEGRARPESFDGTHWGKLMLHTRTLSLSASESYTRPHTASSGFHSTEPPSPPLTNKDCSPMIERSELLLDSRPSPSEETISSLDRFDDLHDLETDRRFREVGEQHNPQGKGPSLWAELRDPESSHALIPSRTEQEMQHSDNKQPDVQVLVGDQTNARSRLSYYAVALRCGTIASTMRIAYLWYHWVKFLALLIAAVTVILLEGPGEIDGEPRLRMNNILCAEQF